ncbi:PREDICTED: interleukin-2 [Elephantulus edwardii]|uniref:interleukin-2 n=1 Tax=Elephantulus edwardii TaxID=28737 RepID=UPI0003F094D5|nr:PREDICTED: interleukin-2 [Elephantulus edwardii]
MYKIQFLSCIALTLALITHSAPPSNSTKEMQQLEQLLLDLRSAANRVKITEKKHLQCLVEELTSLERILNVALDKEKNRELISNINVTALELKGSETAFQCDDDNTETVDRFLINWIEFCQRMISTLA